MKKRNTLIIIFLGALIPLLLFVSPMVAEIDMQDGNKAVSAEAEDPSGIPISTTLFLFGTGLIGMVTIRRKKEEVQK